MGMNASTKHRAIRATTEGRLKHYHKGAETPKPDHLTCDRCGGRIRKNHRYVIVRVVHRACFDPKLVGQLSIAEAR